MGMGTGCRAGDQKDVGTMSLFPLPSLPGSLLNEHIDPPHTDQAELKKPSGDEMRVKEDKGPRGMLEAQKKAREEVDGWETEWWH